MDIINAQFVKSSTNIQQLPPPNYPEYGFVGRSNVGKSSWINALCNRKSLAKTSSTPGKTQLINHFMIDNKWYIADLPGYGYAKVSKKTRSGFVGMISEYVTLRENLQMLFVLTDSRVKPQQIDLEFIYFLGQEKVPFTLLFTKTDQLNQKEFTHSMRNYQDALLQQWEELPFMILTSAKTGRGRSKVLTLIDELNVAFHEK
jgi:GTP-binding protein